MPLDAKLLHDTLKKTFGFDKFRPGQQEAIFTLFNHDRLLCIQPTGHGKSLLYQLSSCLLGGITLVISPLLALMRDQIKHLNERFKIAAAAINSDQSDQQNADARRYALLGKTQVLFIAPEQLDHVDHFTFILSLNIQLIVIDEAHCISTWGHDFRPSYRQILHLVSSFTQKKTQIKILALTATADQRVEEDIKFQLTLADKPIKVMRESMSRPNIRLSVVKQHGLAAKLEACAKFLTSAEGCGLIYCATRDHVELLAEFLQQRHMNVAAYHAGFDSADKTRLQSEFIQDKYQALVATNALGMGIDKSNLRFIIHFDIPGSITAYYQEIGRCGRDGLPAQATLLFDPADRHIQEYFIDSAIPSVENFSQVLKAVFSAAEPLNLSGIKRTTGLHPTLTNMIVSELIEQHYFSKHSQKGVQVYSSFNKQEMPDLSRYKNQEQVKRGELQKMLNYAYQGEECRMKILTLALGDLSAHGCGHCDVCRSVSIQPQLSPNDDAAAAEWLKDRPLPIGPIALHKVLPGLSLLDSKIRSPIFTRFMKDRQAVLTWEEMDSTLIELLFKHIHKLVEKKRLGGIIPIPSKTWKAYDSLLQYLSDCLKVPVFKDCLFWVESPSKRQGELLNNDQRHYNVHKRMGFMTIESLPTDALIIFDDYIGSGNTLKEASRAIRAEKLKNELIPFTIASVKWHLGKPGFS